MPPETSIPYPSPRLKWLASLIKDLLRVDDRWTSAKLLDNPADPLQKCFVLFCSQRLGDDGWGPLKRVIRRWAEQNDCVAKAIRRYVDRVEVDLFIKYLARESDFSPYEELPRREQRWRRLNKLD